MRAGSDAQYRNSDDIIVLECLYLGHTFSLLGLTSDPHIADSLLSDYILYAINHDLVMGEYNEFRVVVN